MANQPKKYRKFLVGAASAALVATAVAPVVSAAEYTDIKGNTHEEAVNELSAAGIISGYQDGTFQPNKILKRSDVVKLMGKWLVSLGNDIPTDYKSNIRFNDLTTSSDNELLQYAALVYDKGVFKGNEGVLDAAGSITRENMALVLVRAYDSINGTDLVKTVKEATDFASSVTDRPAAKAEAQPYIDVLDYFNITAVTQFNPKTTTTRGHFASFLYRTIGIEEGAFELRISGVTALNDTNQFLRIDFSKPVTSVLAPSDINIKDAKTGASYGVKEVKLAANGMSAQVELFQAKENTNVLQYLTDYTIGVSANAELLTYTFNRPAFIDSQVVHVNPIDRKITVVGVDVTSKDYYGETRTLEVPKSMTDFDFQTVLGEEVNVWFDEKNRVVNFNIAEQKAKYDAIEITKKNEIKLLTEDKKYDTSDAEYSRNNEKFTFYLNGEEKELEDYIDAKFNYAKVGFDDSGDILFVQAYNLNQYLVVDKVEGNEVVGLEGDGTGGAFNAKDATIIKNGKNIERTDLKKGDVLFFNNSLKDKEKFAEVYSNTVSGKIDTVFEKAIRIGDKTYDFVYDQDQVGKFGIDYAKAVYVKKNGKTDYVDYKAAEELQAAGNATVHLDRAGNVVYISGDLADVQSNTKTSILVADIAIDSSFGKDLAQIETVSEDGEEKLYQVRLEDLNSISVNGKDFDVENTNPDADEWKVSISGGNIELTNGQAKKFEERLIKIPLKSEGSLVNVVLTNSGDVKELEFFTTDTSIGSKEGFGSSTDTVEPGDSYVGGKRLQSSTLVFDATDGYDKDSGALTDIKAKDVKVTTWGDYKGSDISATNFIYNDKNEVIALVIKQTTTADEVYEEAVITNVLRDTDRKIVEINAFVNGKLETFKVDKLSNSSLDKGHVAVLEFSKNNKELVKSIDSITTGNGELGSRVKTGDVSNVNVGSREVTVNGVIYRLVSDGLVINAADRNKIETKNLTDLRGKKNVTVVLDEKTGTFAKYIVYGGVTTVNHAPVAKPDVAPSTVVGGEEITLTASDYATDADNDALTFTSATPGANTTATVTDGKLVITAKEVVGDVTDVITAVVTDGKASVSVTITVNVTKKIEDGDEVDGTKLSDLPADAFSITPNTILGRNTITLINSKLPATFKDATSYTLTVGDKEYSLTKNPFDDDRFVGISMIVDHTEVEIKAGIVKAVK